MTLVGLIVYAYFFIPWVMETIGTSVITSVIACLITYFILCGVLMGKRYGYGPRHTTYHDYDRWDD